MGKKRHPKAKRLMIYCLLSQTLAGSLFHCSKKE
jgi:hypothetical protein